MEPRPIHTIAIYPRPHIDPICAIFLLRQFGEEYFPGVGQASIAYWNQVPDDKTAAEWEAEGVLLIDLGGGKFDHHSDDHDGKRDCAATLVARHLGIEQRPELRKVLQFAKRDDLEGKGIISKDPLDRSFGLPAIVMNLNRDYPNHPDYVIDTVYRIVLAHYHEEYRRKVLMPQEWQHLQEHGKAEQFTVMTEGERLRVVMIQTDSKGMIGFLRALKGVQADVVIQRTSSGHTNIVTRQSAPRLNMRPVSALLRYAEAKKKGSDMSKVSLKDLEKPGRLTGIEEWYFDTAANTLQNGGAATEGISPTQLSLANLRAILEKGLGQSVNNFTTQEKDTKPTLSLRDLPPRPPRSN